LEGFRAQKGTSTVLFSPVRSRRPRRPRRPRSSRSSESRLYKRDTTRNSSRSKIKPLRKPLKSRKLNKRGLTELLLLKLLLLKLMWKQRPESRLTDSRLRRLERQSKATVMRPRGRPRKQPAAPVAATEGERA
jgi:hypothetical protein